MEVKLENITPNAELNIVRIARVSSSRKDRDEKPEELINYLIKNKHWSPFEHSFMTMEIETSKAIGIQLLRHRSFTFQEFSQRYADVTKFELIEIRKQHKSNRQSSTEAFDPLIEDYRAEHFNAATPKIEQEIETEASFVISGILFDIQTTYERLLDAGVAKECARMILPMTTSTTIFMSGSIRSWIHLIDIRADSHAQKEMQIIAEKMRKIFIEQLPIISKALGWNT